MRPSMVGTREQTVTSSRVIWAATSAASKVPSGASTEVTGDVGGETYTFVPDVQHGEFLGSDEGVVPNEDQFADYGFVYGGNAASFLTSF